MSPRNPRDLWAGVLYIAIGGAVLAIGSGYSMGSSARMGPGYFPIVLGGLLTLLGAVSVGRSFVRSGAAISAIAWKPLVLVLGATILFGLLLPRAGLVIALLALIGVCASASRHARLDWRYAVMTVGVIAFCALVFVKGLGVPMPLLGSWFSGFGISG